MTTNNNNIEERPFQVPDNNCFTFVDNIENKPIGALKVENNSLVFEGNADESAKVFFDLVKKLFDSEIKANGYKSSLQTIANMHRADCQNNTAMVNVSPHLISAETVKGGTKVSMGAAPEVIYDIMDNKKMLLLLIVDKVEFQKRNG